MSLRYIHFLINTETLKSLCCNTDMNSEHDVYIKIYITIHIYILNSLSHISRHLAGGSKYYRKKNIYTACSDFDRINYQC